MRLWSEEAAQGKRHHSCPSIQNIHDAEQVCQILGVPFHIINLENQFKQHVIDYFCQEYTQGRTPNPCIACNWHIKFGVLLDHALSLGADYLATGHYVRVEYYDNAYHLLKGIDQNKDQSYILYTLGQEKLSRVIFPLGDHLKSEVQELARQKGLPTAGKPSSQDICFIPTDYGSFLSRYSAATPGEIIDSHGKVLGRHRGTAFYTVGQRHGLGLTTTKPIYITRIEPDKNRLIVGSKEDLYSSGLTATAVNWVSGKTATEPLAVAIKIRYRSPEVAAIVFPDHDSVKLRFNQPQPAVTPGQAVVFYQDSEVLGGGTIEI
jgi:tRNA-specific 2-thiouridylase